LLARATVRDEFTVAELRDFKESVAIVVSSCDAFFDAWQPFNFFLKRFWPDCPFEIFLLTNAIEVRSPRIHSLALGPDRGWSSNLLNALDRVRYPYIFYAQEDYFLTAPVQNQQMANDFVEMIQKGASALCFRARSKPDAGFQPLNDRFGIVPIDSDGRTRCQVTLWNREALQSILRPGETAWDFEARGSARTKEMKIFSYNRRDNTPIPYLMSAISRGFWMPDALRLCETHAISIEPLIRPVHSPNSWARGIKRRLSKSRFNRALLAAKKNGLDLA
jgi:hypothetical protein